VGTVTSAPLDTFRPRDAIVTALAYASGAATAAAFVALATAVVALGWADLRYAFSGPVQLGTGLTYSLLVVAVALPVTMAIGIPAAACASEPIVGTQIRVALLASLRWSLGLPPVVIGVAAFFVAMTFVRSAGIGAGIAALIVLNLSNATARFAQAYASVPAAAREAAAAAGASPVLIFFSIVQRRAVWAVSAATLTIAAQMIGETSAVLAASGARSAQAPLPLQIWQYASDAGMAPSEASSCIVLVLSVAACLSLARVCRGRHRSSMAS